MGQKGEIISATLQTRKVAKDTFLEECLNEFCPWRLNASLPHCMYPIVPAYDPSLGGGGGGISGQTKFHKSVADDH